MSDEAQAGAAATGGSRDEASPAGPTPAGKAPVGPARGFDGFAPETLETAGRRFVVRRATESDVPALVELLRDDVLGTAREGSDGADDAAAYGRAYALIAADPNQLLVAVDRKSTRLNSSHVAISYAVFCLKKKK